MASLVRIVYISRSTFAPSQSEGIAPGLARILAKSRKNNRQANVVGGLLFGDGCFLQCLEGDAAAVDTLYNKIAADPRHRDVKLVSRAAIDRLGFADWSMKYVPMEQPLRALLQSQGLRRFDPYSFTPANFAAVLEALHAQHDPSQNYEPAVLASAGEQAQKERRALRASAPAGSDGDRQLARRALTRANWALAFAILAGIALAASQLRALH